MSAAIQRAFLDLLTFPDGDHTGLVGMSPDVQELAQADTVDSLRRVMEDDELWQTLIDTVRWTTDAYKDIDVTEAERQAFEQLLMNYGVGLITLLRMRGRVDA